MGGMKAVLAAVFLALAAGCSSHSVVAVGAGAPPPAVQGTAITSGASGLSITTTSGAAALALVLTFGAVDYALNPRPLPDPSSFFTQSAPAPQLAGNRRINEVDCTKPVDLTLGNLKCK